MDFVKATQLFNHYMFDLLWIKGTMVSPVKPLSVLRWPPFQSDGLPSTEFTLYGIPPLGPDNCISMV